jgi:hypothetical protein
MHSRYALTSRTFFTHCPQRMIHTVSLLSCSKSYSLASDNRWVTTALLLTHALASTAGAIEIAVETVGPMSSKNQAAWWSPIVERDGEVFVSYLHPNAPQDDVYVAQRSVDGVWSTVDTGVDARYDPGHTQTSLVLDSQGRLNVAYGMHGDAMQLVRSHQPGSITGGFSVPTSAMGTAFSGGKYTYPNMTTAPNGDVYMIVRDRRNSTLSATGRLYRMSASTGTWSQLPPFAGQAGTTVYPDHIVADETGDLHIVWEWAAGGPQGARHYGSYARFDPDTNTYFRANGDAFPTGAISIANADIFQGLEGNETFEEDVNGFQSAKMTLDDQNRPLIAYTYSIDTTDSSYEHRLARWSGSEWTRATITPGPFNSDKPWITYSGGVLRYYGTLAPGDPAHTGHDDIFVRTSSDLGTTWSDPIAVTNGLDIQRPVGVTVDGTDYLYLPDISRTTLYFAKLSGFEPTVAILPGDYNDDGVVNLSDYTLWRDNLGARVALANEQPGVTPGVVTSEDYEVWRANFGSALANSNASATTVAEPASLMLLACGFGLAYFEPSIKGNRLSDPQD